VRVALLVTLLAATGLQTTQATLAGTWSGTLIFKGPDPAEETLVLVLKQDGATLTGTAGPDADRQYKITKGKTAAAGGVTSITFDLIINGVLSSFDLKLVDGRLNGEATSEGEDGHKRVATVELRRL
jgi:hypothetical protein